MYSLSTEIDFTIRGWVRFICVINVLSVNRNRLHNQRLDKTHIYGTCTGIITNTKNSDVTITKSANFKVNINRIDDS